MLPTSLGELCDLVSDAAMANAGELSRKFASLVRPHSVTLDPETVLKIFAFMNWSFAAGVWSSLRNTRLRRDLQIELKHRLIMKLAAELAGSEETSDMAAKAVFVTEDFNSYVEGYGANVRNMSYADSRTAKLFALERIQEELSIHDDVMSSIVPALWADESTESRVESVAGEVNKAAQGTGLKGCLLGLLGR